VTIFVYDCGDGCNRARTLLAKRGVPHTVKDPLTREWREELKKATGGDEVVPVLQVGRQVLRGFEEALECRPRTMPATPRLHWSGHANPGQTRSRTASRAGAGGARKARASRPSPSRTDDA